MTCHTCGGKGWISTVDGGHECGLCHKESHDLAVEKVVATLRDLAASLQNDPEAAQSCAEDAIVEFLRAVGYAEVAKAWDDIPGWGP